MRRSKMLTSILEAKMLEVARRPPAGAEHTGEDDCPMCRMLAGLTPLESFQLPDGSILELHALPAAAVLGGGVP